MATKKKGTAAPTRSSKAAARRVSAKTAEAKEPTPVTIVDSTTLTPEQQEVAAASKPTSNIEAGGVEKVKDTAIRMESEGVLTPIKSDFDNPESPVIGDPEGALVGPKDPGKVTIGPGETAAQHEAHVLMNSPQRIADRIEQESGPDGLPTDVIMRRQAEDVAREQFQRVSALTPPADTETIQSGSNDNTKRAGTPPR